MPAGIVFNPFIEGVLLVLIGLGAIAAGHLMQAPDLTDAGKGLIPFGIGYFAHAAVQKAP